MSDHVSRRVTHTLAVYEVDDQATEGLDVPEIVVVSHWNRNSFVVLEVGGKRYTVGAAELNNAIANAQRWSR